MKICLVGAEFHVERETDRYAHPNMTKLIFAFRNFANATKNVTS